MDQNVVSDLDCLTLINVVVYYMLYMVKIVCLFIVHYFFVDIKLNKMNKNIYINKS